MEFCLFLDFANAAVPVPQTELDATAALCRSASGIARALLHLPGETHDPYLDDGPSPALALQLYFAGMEALEQAAGREGALQGLGAALPSLAAADVSQQAMLVRHFPVAHATLPEREPHATYLVAYGGTAADMNAWLAYYVAHHPPIMARFPGIRQIEICSRLDWCGFLPYPRVNHMQRNKVVFDDAAALTAALNSEVRHEMRRDFVNFPAFEGSNTHYPMRTWVLI